MDAKITISCSHCGFQRDLPADSVPDQPVQVTCPQCRRSFPFQKAESGSREEPAAAPPVPDAAVSAPTHDPVRDEGATRPSPMPIPGRPPATQKKAAGGKGKNRRRSLILLLLAAVCSVSVAVFLYMKPMGSVGTLFPREEAGPSPSAGVPAAQPVASDLHVFVHAVNVTTTIRVNGQDFRAITAEPNREYNINAFGEQFRAGSNTIDFECTPLAGGRSGAAPEVQMRVWRFAPGGPVIYGEWRITGREGWRRSVQVTIPEGARR